MQTKGPLYARVRLSVGFPVKLVPNKPSTLLLDTRPISVKAGVPVEIAFSPLGFTVRMNEAAWNASWVALTPNEAPPSVQPAVVHGAQVNGRYTYRARLEALIYGGVPYLINVVPMNDYLYGVLGSEMPLSWPLESLKAQAVAARTFALYHIVYREAADRTPWDLCDTTDCQVYSGTSKESLAAYDAVRATDRSVLVYSGSDAKYNGQLINAVYHSTSPGRTFNAEEVWTSARPYLRSRDDAMYSCISPVYEWNRNFSISVQALAAILGMKQITQIAPAGGSGEPLGYTVSGGGVSRSFSKEELRKWFHMPSPSYDLQTSGGKLVNTSVSPGSSLTTVNGRGFGHGVGLSQYGAKAMADHGWGYNNILSFYYTDVTIRQYNLSGMRLPKGYPGH